MTVSEEKNETGKVASERVYNGRVISVDMDTVRFPDGSLGKLEMVRHPGASAVVPILDENSSDPHILLIRQYRYAADGFLYEIPAGRLDPGESPLECARRELLEETGYSAARIDPLTSLYTTPGFTDEKIHIFTAAGLTPGEHKREADEFLELVPRRLSDILRMLANGEIQDAKTAVGIFSVAELIRRS